MSKEYRTTSIAKTTGTLFIKPPCTRCIIGEFVYVSPITVIYGCKRIGSVCAPPSLHLPFRPLILDAIKHVSTLIAGATGTTSPVNSIAVDRGIVIGVSYGQAPQLEGRSDAGER